MLLSTLVLAWGVSFVSSSAPTSGKNGAVVTEVGRCSVGILKTGGNAADAVRLLLARFEHELIWPLATDHCQRAVHLRYFQVPLRHRRRRIHDAFEAVLPALRMAH